MEDINVVVKDECQKLSQKLHFFISQSEVCILKKIWSFNINDVTQTIEKRQLIL